MSIDQLSSIKVKPVQGRDCQAPELVLGHQLVAHVAAQDTFVAEADTYGADKLWVVLKPIPIELEEDEGDGQSSSPAASLPPSLPTSLPTTPGYQMPPTAGASQ